MLTVFLDFSQSSVFIGRPLPARDEKTHDEDFESALKRIGPRLRVLQSVAEFDAGEPIKNLMHGHVKELTYKRLLEAFEAESKVGDVAIFKNAVFNNVTYVAYALKGEII